MRTSTSIIAPGVYEVVVADHPRITHCIVRVETEGLHAPAADVFIAHEARDTCTASDYNAATRAAIGMHELQE